MKLGLAPASLNQQSKLGNLSTAQSLADWARQLGYEGVEVPGRLLPPPEDVSANKAIGRYLKKANLYVDMGTATVHDLAALVRAGEHHPLFDQARDLGADRIKVVLEVCGQRFFDHWPISEMGARLTRTIDDLGTVASAAESAGLRVVCENHIDYTNSELTTIFEAVDSSAVGIMFDTANQFAMTDDPLELAARLGDRIFSLHLKDAYPVEHPDGVTLTWCVPGTGLVDFDQILSAIPDVDAVHANLELITGGPWVVPFDSEAYWAVLPHTREERSEIVSRLSATRPDHTAPHKADLGTLELEELKASLRPMQELRDRRQAGSQASSSGVVGRA